MLRIKENTKIQSNVSINRNRDMNKGEKLNNHLIQSRFSFYYKIYFLIKKHKYHEEFEKSKGSYTVVADDPETRRVLENSKNISLVSGCLNAHHKNYEKNENL